MIVPTSDKLKLTDRMVAFINYYFTAPIKVLHKGESAGRLKADVLGHPPKCKGYF